MDAVSRELGVEIYRLEAWRNQAMEGMESALKKRDGEPLMEELKAARQHIGELTMKVAVLSRMLRCDALLPGGSGGNEEDLIGLRGSTPQRAKENGLAALTPPARLDSCKLWIISRVSLPPTSSAAPHQVLGARPRPFSPGP